MTGNGWQFTRTSIWETHHYTFIVANCTLKPASVPNIVEMIGTIALATVTTICTTLS
jgi:hypothetical protein